MEWYQPVHDPYNLFSFPWQADQLKAEAPNLEFMTDTNIPGFATDSTPGTYEVQWKAGAGSGKTTATSNEVSWHASASVSYGSPKWMEAAGASYDVGVKAEYNGSHGFGDVDTS